MKISQNEQAAWDRAEKYAPKPTGGALRTGFTGAAVGAMAIWGVLGFYSLRPASHAPWIVGGALIGFIAAFVAYKRLARKNIRARNREMAHPNSDLEKRHDE